MNRGGPLGRGPGPSRHTPLTASTGLSRGGPLPRHQPREPRDRTRPARTRTGRGRCPTCDAGEALARRVVRDRSGGVCEVCARARADSWHHRVKQGQGGPWCPANGLHVCGDGTRGCHGWIEHHLAAARDLGYALHPRATPDAEPVLLPRHGLVLLDHHGGHTRAVDSHRSETHP